MTVAAVSALAAATVLATAPAGAAADSPVRVESGPAIRPHHQLEGVSAVSANNAWAAGVYRAPSGKKRTYALHYNGIRWSHIVTPNAGGTNNELYDILGVAPGEVWAVGQAAARRGGLALHRTGAGWHIVKTPVPPQGSAALTSLSATGRADVWAVGFTQGEFGARTLTLHWDGSRWKRVPSPNVGASPFCELYAVHAISPSDVWAVGTSFDRGRPLALHWNGTRWTVVPTPRPGGEEALYFPQSVSASSPSNVWVSGPIQYFFKNAPAKSRPTAMAFHWNGSRWIDESSAATPPAGMVANSFTSQVVGPGRVWAMGDRFLGRYDASLAELRTASGWHVRSSPVRAYVLAISDMSASAPDDIWAAGVYLAAPRSAPRAILLHWDGHSWTDVVI